MTESAKACPGPNPPSPPSYPLPPGTTDCHVHVVGPFDKYPLAARRAYTPPESTLSDLKHYLEVVGIDRVVVVHATVAGDGPDITLDALAELGDRARGVVMANDPASDAQIKAWHERGIRAARITSFGGVPLTTETVREVASRIAPYGWHLLYFAVSAEEWNYLEPTLVDLPCEVCVEHMGGRIFDFDRELEQKNFQSLRKHLAEGTLWSKISGYFRYSSDQSYPWPNSIKFAQSLIDANPERLIWGSDWPYPALFHKPMHTPDETANWWEQLSVTGADRERILIHNPEQLYGFGSTA